MTWDLSQSPRHTGVEQTGKEAGFAVWDSEHPWETHRGQWQRSEGPFDQPLSHAPPAGRSGGPTWSRAGGSLGTRRGRGDLARKGHCYPRTWDRASRMDKDRPAPYTGSSSFQSAATSESRISGECA